MATHPPIRLTVKLPRLSEDHAKNRKVLRDILIDKFKEELPGTGKGELASKYMYVVETLNDGKEIYLTRPANLNWGFDFVIHVQGFKLR